MTKRITLPVPQLQIDFAFALKRIRGVALQEALLDTVRNLELKELNRELDSLVGAAELSVLASFGLRGELLFATPLVLTSKPSLLGYYRMLLGYSQKEFYEKDLGLGRFKVMEEKGRVGTVAPKDLRELCSALCVAGSSLLHGLDPIRVSSELLDDLTLLTLGPQLRGGANNQRGAAGIIQVFEIIREAVSHARPEVRERSICVRNAAGRLVLIEFAADPDIIVREQLSERDFRKVVAIEVKAGTDVSNVHNRIGEAEKSHQKARQSGFTECWTVTNVSKLNLTTAKKESPSTDRFYGLSKLKDASSAEFADFVLRILALTGIAAKS
jgi:hypothetical protein